MTTNIDRAAAIIAPWIEKEWGHPEDNAESAADALADAGLLMPDIPEPDDVDPEREATWVPHPLVYAVYAYKHGLYGTWNVAMDSAPSDLSPEDTRRLAYALLAAADHAKEESNHD